MYIPPSFNDFSHKVDSCIFGRILCKSLYLPKFSLDVYLLHLVFIYERLLVDIIKKKTLNIVPLIVILFRMLTWN